MQDQFHFLMSIPTITTGKILRTVETGKRNNKNSKSLFSFFFFSPTAKHSRCAHKTKIITTVKRAMTRTAMFQLVQNRKIGIFSNIKKIQGCSSRQKVPGRESFWDALITNTQLHILKRHLSRAAVLFKFFAFIFQENNEKSDKSYNNKTSMLLQTKNSKFQRHKIKERK